MERTHIYSPIPKIACARCGHPAPGKLGGEVNVRSPKQTHPYDFKFCEGCLDELHPKLGKLIGDFVNSYPREQFTTNLARVPEYGLVTGNGKPITFRGIVERIFG